MATPKQVRAINLYANLMDEVKVRIASINAALVGGTGLPPLILREFCFLQLRMLCELIALGCLTAHGDIEETTRLRKQYAADRIVGELERLHPTFYPWPLREVGPKQFEGINEGFLTKVDLIKLNGECGNVLHRGSLKKLLSPREASGDLCDVAKWGNRITTLLGIHGLLLIYSNTSFLCMLQNIDNGNNVQIVIMERATK
jgi:hypothetical protein